MKRYMIIIVILLLLSAAGCASRKKYDWSPGTIAVLPFTNESADVAVETFVRYCMHERLAQRGHPVVSIEDIDAKLDELGITEGGQLPTIGIEKLAEHIDTDTFMYGDVLEAKRLMLGVYFKKKLTVRFTLFEGNTGKQLWEVQETSEEKQFTVNPDALVGTAMRSFADELSHDAASKVFNSHPLMGQIEEVVNHAVWKLPRPPRGDVK